MFIMPYETHVDYQMMYYSIYTSGLLCHLVLAQTEGEQK